MRLAVTAITAITAFALIRLAAAPALAQDDRHEELATLPLAGGYPSEEVSRTLDEELYFQRACQTYLWALPAMNMYAMKTGLGDQFGYGYNVISVYEKRLKPNTVITTPNSDVIYGLGWADLSETGPLVVEVPAGLQGLMDDMWHRPLVGPVIEGDRRYLGDLGLPGPDKGKGGRYLLVTAETEDVPDSDEYFVFRSRTNSAFIFLRGFFKSVQDLSPGVRAIEGVKIYPLRGERKDMEFVHASDLPSNALFSHDFSYFESLDRFIQEERVDPVDPYMHGVMAALGIRKGHEFAPTERQKELLDQAAGTAWRMAKNIAADFDQQPDGLWWEDRHWVAHAHTHLDDFMRTLLDEEYRDRETGHVDVDAKAHMYVNHYSISTGMISSVVGLGAKYGGAYKDSEGKHLMGQNTYTVTFPPDPPAGLFWSLTLYDAATASGVDAEGQDYPSLNSMNELAENDDGSVTFHVGPERPADAKNFLETVPGEGWFALFRFYGPTQAFFDRQYKVGDFELVGRRR